jgi:hypothetical protein
MSTKTLRKRIAVVAVSALTAGLFSVVSVPVANAAAFDTLSATGICTAIDATTGLPETLADDSGTVVLALGGTLTLASGDDASGFSIEAGVGTIISSDGAADVIAPNGLSIATVDDDETITIRASTVGKAKVTHYLDATPATIEDYLYIQVVTSCSASTWSSTFSGYATGTAIDDDSTLTGETGAVYTFADEDTAFISLLGRNGYNQDLDTGVWVVSATGDVVVGIGATAPTVGVTPVATASINGTNADGGDDGALTDAGVFIAVEQKTSGTALSTLVTVTYNGATVYSKTLNFTGDLASITVSGADVQAVGGATLASLYDVVAKDAAGNLIIWSLSGDTTKYNTLVTSVSAGFTTTTGTGRLDATADNTDDAALGLWTCGSKSGSTMVRLKGTTNAGATVFSNEFEARCGGAAYTYTASLDKASYVPGDIATLTITAKDASGFAPFKGETVDQAQGVPSIGGSQLTPINTPVAADTFNSPIGQKIYTFTVGSTSGKYNMAVNLGYSGNSAVSVAYTVASSGEVSNAEVLKSIVALIASINKQIQALQKLILKR